jgi:hypothetical protein
MGRSACHKGDSCQLAIGSKRANDEPIEPRAEDIARRRLTPQGGCTRSSSPHHKTRVESTPPVPAGEHLK